MTTDTAPTFAITSDVQFAQPAPVERKARAKRTTHTSAGAMPLDEAPKDGTRLWL